MAIAHNDNGVGSVLPFEVDYTAEPSVSLNPRETALLLQNNSQHV